MQRLLAIAEHLIILPQRVMQGLPFTQLLLVIQVQRYMPIPVDSLVRVIIQPVRETPELLYIQLPLETPVQHSMRLPRAIVEHHILQRPVEILEPLTIPLLLAKQELHTSQRQSVQMARLTRFVLLETKPMEQLDMCQIFIGERQRP